MTERITTTSRIFRIAMATAISAGVLAGCASRTSSDWAQVSPAAEPNQGHQSVNLAAWQGGVYDEDDAGRYAAADSDN